MEGLVLHEDESGGKQGEYADPSPSSSTIRPKRRMSRRYSMHQRNESAPDFFNDIDADDLKKAFAIDVDDAGASGSNDRRQSPAASAVFSIDGTNPVPKPASEVRVKRTQHSRRRSESSDEWEIGLRNALNLEVSKFKSEENKKKMKATYKRALMPRGMLKVRTRHDDRVCPVHAGGGGAAPARHSRPRAHQVAGGNEHPMRGSRRMRTHSA